jgi:hypothetical protein
MDEVRLAEFLEGQRYAVLATSGPDGRPQAAPVAYTIWNSAFGIASVGGACVRNLRARSYASIVVMEGEGPSHRAVTAEGPVILHDAAEFERVLREFGDLWVTRHGEVPTGRQCSSNCVQIGSFPTMRPKRETKGSYEDKQREREINWPLVDCQALCSTEGYSRREAPRAYFRVFIWDLRRCLDRGASAPSRIRRAVRS